MIASVSYELNDIAKANAPENIGGDEAALSWNTLLAFGAILLAAMQGTLVMESADPCRISYKKWQMLVTFLLLEVIVVVASEVASFRDLSLELQVRLIWLQWLPPCLLTLGLLELLLDVWFTLYLGVRSRIHWLPFSSVGYSGERKGRVWRSLLEVVPIMSTASLSLFLIGWRMRWWFEPKSVLENVAQESSKNCAALSRLWLGTCIGFSFLLSSLSLILICVIEKYAGKRSSLFLFKESWNPRKYYEKNPSMSFRNNWEALPEDERLCEILFKIKYGRDSEISEETKKRNLKTTPLHLGNAMIGRDNQEVHVKEFSGLHVMVLLVEHFTILPLQICIVIAVVKLHDKLDTPTFKALKELAEAVVVVALVEIAVGFKSFLWGFAFVDELHNNDRAIGDPLLQDMGEPGVLRRLLMCLSIK